MCLVILRAYGGKGEIWWGNLKEGDHLEDTGEDERIILKWIFRGVGWGTWTGSIWLRIRTGGGLL